LGTTTTYQPARARIFSVNCCRHLHIFTDEIRPSYIEISSRITSLSSIDTLATFGDFGLSRESRDPTTVCGTLRYAAPEVFNEKDRKDGHHKKRSYTLAVDIWSLGVTVFQCVYDLPFPNATGVSWCQEIVKKLKRDLERNPDDLKQLLCDSMVIVPPELRRPAQYCHEQVVLLIDKDRSPTPTPASYAQSYQRPAGQYSVADDDGADQATVVLGDAHAIGGYWPSPSLDDDVSAEIRRYIRSGGPPPVSQASVSFHDSWLQNPLDVLGGESAVAALGLKSSDSSGWATQLEGTPRYTGFPGIEDIESPPKETRKRSTRQSKSSSSSGRHRKRRGHSSVAAGSSTRRHCEEPEPEALLYRREPKNEDYGPALLEEPNWAEFRFSGTGQVCDLSPFHNSDAFAEDAPAPTQTQGRHKGEWESPWTESEAQMAEALLLAIH
jgi:serine/threonine protein kinase